MTGSGEYEDLVGQALSEFSKSKNDIVDLKIGQARMEEKLDAHRESTEHTLTEILKAVGYTNGKVRTHDKLIAILQDRDKRKATATGGQIIWTKVLLAVLKLVGVIIGSVSTAWAAVQVAKGGN